jgi:hypothetical protein
MVDNYTVQLCLFACPLLTRDLAPEVPKGLLEIDVPRQSETLIKPRGGNDLRQFLAEEYLVELFLVPRLLAPECKFAFFFKRTTLIFLEKVILYKLFEVVDCFYAKLVVSNLVSDLSVSSIFEV